MDRTTQSSGPVAGVEVRTIRFPLVRKGGYDPREVDPFLKTVAQAIDAGEQADPTVNAQYIHDVRFSTVRRGGYTPAAVDAFLDRVIDTLDPPRSKPQDSAQPSSPTPDAVRPQPGPGGPTALEKGQANLDRLRVLYEAGLLSDKELSVLANRVKRRAREEHQGVAAVG